MGLAQMPRLASKTGVASIARGSRNGLFRSFCGRFFVQGHSRDSSRSRAGPAGNRHPIRATASAPAGPDVSSRSGAAVPVIDPAPGQARPCGRPATRTTASGVPGVSRRAGAALARCGLAGDRSRTKANGCPSWCRRLHNSAARWGCAGTHLRARN